MLYEELSGMRSCTHLYMARIESRGKERMRIYIYDKETAKGPRPQGSHKGVSLGGLLER